MKTFYSLSVAALLLAGLIRPASAQAPQSMIHPSGQTQSFVRKALPPGSAAASRALRADAPAAQVASVPVASPFRTLGTANPASRLSRLPDLRRMIAEGNAENGSTNRTLGAPGTSAPQTLSGNWQWAKRFGARDTVQTESSQYLATDASGNVYMCFNYKGTVEMGTSTFTSNNRSWDIMVVSYNPQGTQRWVRSFGGSGVEVPAGLQIDPAGNLRMAAVSTGSINFGSGISYTYQAGSGVTTLFTLNISTLDGSPLFVRNMWGTGSSSFIVGYDMDVDVNGNAIIVGQISGDYNVTGGSGGSGNDEAFVASFSGIPSGTGANWLYRVSETITGNSAVFTGVAVSGTNRIYCAGQFSGTVAFSTTGSPSLNSQGGTDGLLLYITAAGAWQNARTIGADGDDGFNDIAVGPTNHPFVAGFYGADLVFSAVTVPYQGGGADIVEFELDSIVTPLFVSNGGGTDLESAYAIEVSRQNVANIAGFYNGAATFDQSSVTSAGGADAVLWRINNTAGTTQAVLSAEGSAGDDVFSRVMTGSTSSDLYACGTFVDQINFTSTLSLNTRQTTGNQADGFLAKVGASCNFNPSFNILVSGLTCQGNTVGFSASGVPAGSSYAWSGPNGFASTQQTFQLTLGASQQGVYSLILTDGLGCSSATQTVTVSVENIPAPQALNVTRCGSGAVTFQPSSSFPNGTYQWYTQPTGGSAVASTQGNYTTGTLTANTTYYFTRKSNYGCESPRVSVSATIDQPFSATINPGDQAICQGSSANLTALPAGRNYLWSNGLTNQSIDVMTGGQYTVTVGQLPACTASASVNITVLPRPSAAFQYNAGTYCQSGANPTPLITGTVGGSFRGSAGLSINTTSGTINLAATAPGNYQVTYRVGGQCRDSATTNITISSNPVAVFTYGAPSACQINGSQLQANLSPGASAGVFSARPAGLNLNATTGTVLPGLSQAGSYVVVNAVPASGGCPAVRDSVTLTISPTPQITVIASPSATACEGDRVVLKASSTIPGTITWSPSGTGDSIIVTTAGTYQASSIVGTCQGTSAPVTVTFTQRPAVPSINQTPVGGGFLLSITGGQPGTTYNWYLNGNLQSTHSGQLSVFDASLSGAYTVEAVFQGCVSQLSTPVVVVITGLKNKVLAGLRVFPNPAHGTLTVDMPKGSSRGTAQLMSTDGKSIRLTSALAEGANRLDVSNLARGLYLLKVISSEGVSVQSITIE